MVKRIARAHPVTGTQLDLGQRGEYAVERISWVVHAVVRPDFIQLRMVRVKVGTWCHRVVRTLADIHRHKVPALLELQRLRHPIGQQVSPVVPDHRAARQLGLVHEMMLRPVRGSFHDDIRQRLRDYSLRNRRCFHITHCLAFR